MTYYFTKWVKAASYAEIHGVDMQKSYGNKLSVAADFHTRSSQIMANSLLRTYLKDYTHDGRSN